MWRCVLLTRVLSRSYPGRRLSLFAALAYLALLTLLPFGHRCDVHSVVNADGSEVCASAGHAVLSATTRPDSAEHRCPVCALQRDLTPLPPSGHCRAERAPEAPELVALPPAAARSSELPLSPTRGPPLS